MSETVVSSLKLDVLLGKGAFGEVFRGIHPIHGTVAIKRLTKLAAETPSQWTARWQGLVREGQRLKASEHERVVRVFDVTYSAKDDAVFLVMELCTGGSLQTVYEQGPARLEWLREVITDVALGLAAVHVRGMIHRDMKPANILCDNRRAKIGDFGLVTDDLLLGYASAAGYIDHLAPEVHDRGQTSVKTDLWALGMTIYRMLHGQKFYETLPQPRDKVTAGGFARGLPWLPHVPKRWRTFVRKLMADDPVNRFQSAEQMLTAAAILPIAPDWTCRFDLGQVVWERLTDTRRIIVNLVQSSKQKYTWEANSHPKAAPGRSRTLGGNKTPSSKASVQRELEAFFRKK